MNEDQARLLGVSPAPAPPPRFEVAPPRFAIVIPRFDPEPDPEPDPEEAKLDPTPAAEATDPDLTPAGIETRFRAEYDAATERTSSQPVTWDDIIGNKRAVMICRQACEAAKEQGIPMSHTLLFGPPGTGKTTLSRMIAKEMGSQFFETTTSTLRTAPDVIRTIHAMNLARERTGQPSVLFLDEIHMIGKGTVDQESMYPVLEGWKFYHPCQGKRVALAPENIKIMTESVFSVWPFTAIGATTEPGVLSQALLRRFFIQIEMEPYENDDIAQIILRAASRMTLPITEDAAGRMSQYCRRNPGRAFMLLANARNLMSAAKTSEITTAVVDDTINQLNLYPLGLTQTDVRALQMLSTRTPKGIGKDELSRSLGITTNQFSQMMEPYLRQMGFIQTLNRRVITLAGLRYLNDNNLLDRSRAEVRAALAVGRL